VTLPLALLLLLMAVVGLVCVVFGSSPVPWSRLRRIERHWVRAYGGFLVLLAAAVTAAKALHAVPVTYGLLAAAFVPPLLAALEDNRRARR
jgi:hypothetical protein